MNYFVNLFTALNIARSKGSLPETRNNTVRSTIRLSFDLLSFKDIRTTSSTLGPWYGTFLLNFFAKKIPNFLFFTKLTSTESVHYYSNTYRPGDPKPLIDFIFKSDDFGQVKNSYELYLNDDFCIGLDSCDLFNEDRNDFFKILVTKVFFTKHIFNDFLFAGFNLKYIELLSDAELITLILDDYLKGRTYDKLFIKWNSENDHLNLGLMLISESKNFDFIKLFDDVTLLTIEADFNIHTIKKISRTDFSEPSLSPSTIFHNTYYNNLYKILKSIKLTKKEIYTSIRLLELQPNINDPLIFISFVNSSVGAKSYTMRSRQFYRSGVLFCLALTLITIITPYYLFYGVTFIFSYWWFFTFIFVMRCIILFLWKLTPLRYRIKITHYFNNI